MPQGLFFSNLIAGKPTLQLFVRTLLQRVSLSILIQLNSAVTKRTKFEWVAMSEYIGCTNDSLVIMKSG